LVFGWQLDGDEGAAAAAIVESGDAQIVTAVINATAASFIGFPQG
jgi:hypothetical protein